MVSLGLELVHQLVEAATTLGEAQIKGDAVTVNRQQDKLTRLYGELRTHYPEVETDLKALLGHANGYVRLHAACCLVPMAPLEAKAALSQISEERGLLGLTAELMLEEWEAGRLKI
jgi:hypothetical protein